MGIACAISGIMHRSIINIRDDFFFIVDLHIKVFIRKDAGRGSDQAISTQQFSSPKKAIFTFYNALFGIKKIVINKIPFPHKPDTHPYFVKTVETIKAESSSLTPDQ
jgi:hypothetical protein